MNNNLETIIRKEEKELHREALKKDGKELVRRREEVLLEINHAVKRLEDEQELISSRLNIMKSMMDNLNELPELEANASSSEIREHKRTVRAAHLELVQLSRSATENTTLNIRTAADLTWKQAFALGTAFSFPMILALLASSGLIAAVLYRLFSV